MNNNEKNQINENEDLFNLVDQNSNENDIVVKDEKNQDVKLDSEKAFQFVQADKTIHEKKFDTKPTTFFKDACKRFVKNKSSVVGGVILGFLTILAFLLPVSITSDTTSDHPYETFLQPKLFESGFGWWDGTEKYDNIAYDFETGKPDPAYFVPSAASSIKVTEEQYINTTNTYGQGGYIRFNVDQPKRESGISEEEALSNLKEKRFTSYSIPSYSLSENFKFTYVLNNSEAGLINGDSTAYHNADYKVTVTYKAINSKTATDQPAITIKDYSSDAGQEIDVQAKLAEALPSTSDIYYVRFNFVIKESYDYTEQILIQSAVFSSTSTDEDFTTFITNLSFTDANECVQRVKEISSGVPNLTYWECTGYKNIYKVKIRFCSFVYDTYEAAYGKKEVDNVGRSIIQTYVDNGWMEYDWAIGVSSFKVLDEAKCPVLAVKKQNMDISDTGVSYSLDCDVTFYRYLGYSTMPKFFFGTDSHGKDFIKIVFSGFRTSLLLGVVVSAICFLFGLCWGAIEGYYGGAIDLIMERFCDILGGVPWIVMMTLIIVVWGSSFLTFAIALCLTGWMGTAGRTRTQFYRFRDREYVLASRTLGAKDSRLIFKHILPNALGTIITGAVLMIPSTIFSEATISYLGLGLKGLDSLGVTLSDNQQYINGVRAYLLIVPSVIVALIMISFNLFGNGLRDAVNPSLKGSE